MKIKNTVVTQVKVKICGEDLKSLTGAVEAGMPGVPRHTQYFAPCLFTNTLIANEKIDEYTVGTPNV